MGQLPHCAKFLNAKKLSPWCNVELLKPKNSHQLRYAAKHMFNQKQYFSGLVDYALYFKSKIIK